MSLTILFQFPVDTGTAKITIKAEKANLKEFYLLTGIEMSPNVVDTGHAGGCRIILLLETGHALSLQKKILKKFQFKDFY